ncbi:MAG: tRNA (adenosine(37)-N6)-threonylcarbamoyltransferase complex dimerization subunit type 1 TsaB [Chloroflexi bacterium]|nr:tRNA (adenosine(37)-N6)-threonylcarbamoyltransferase complex dimerization subunit type 1 TsaB [Chloroflexota bacterium]
MLLAIDTSTRYAGVALVREGRLVQLVQWQSQRNHSVELLPTIEALLKREGVTVGAVTGIAVARGPGGFSALRVGMSVAKGLALVLGIPLLTATTLEAEAFGYRAVAEVLGAVLDAGREEVYWAWFERRGARLAQTSEERVGPPREVVREASPQALLCGEGVERHEESLAQDLPPGARLALPYVPALRVASLALLGWAKLQEGPGEDPAAVQPLYVRRPSVTLPSSSGAVSSGP